MKSIIIQIKERMRMFNNYNLSDEEIIKIINDYEGLIVSKSMINFKFDEDLNQEIKYYIYKNLSKNRKKLKNF